MSDKNTITIGVNLDTSQISTQAKSIQQLLGKLNLPPELKREFDTVFDGFGKSLDTYQKKLQNGFKTKGDITGLEKAGTNLTKATADIDKFFQKISSMPSGELEKMFSLSPDAKKKIDEIDTSIKKLKEDLKNTNVSGLEKLDNIIKKFGSDSAKKKGNFIKDLISKGEIDKAIAELDTMQQGFEKAANSFGKNSPKIIATRDALVEFKAALQGEDFSKLNKISTDIANLESSRISVLAEHTNQYSQTLQTAKGSVEQLKTSTQSYVSSTESAATAQQQLTSEIDQMGSRIKHFFSMANAVALVRRALQEAFNSVKELDAAMTETAVVTKFDVGDMWSQMPEYAERASALGVSIKDAYESATLYYQQGLKTNEVMALSNETMKMGRIAGMEAAEATDRMTAALRGFNMELNEASAQRVSDVYSELAAITASDVDEISNAMTKTASIANNANMEFETTAAFLSQIIETTRESAETAGTAMKTVIARFTELKKDPAEIGEIDGEIVDANKIETALRSVGVALRDEAGQFRDLDDVFIELASKWDTLDTNTQRYVATIAAGSRQQSRFIAMMSNYDRTMELVTAANNSAGASQRQYEKTLDSLESKLAKLKNAWDVFILGITNSEVIKTAVDGLTWLLETVNKLTDGLGGLGSGIGKLLITFIAFKAGAGLLPALLASVTPAAKTAGMTAGQAFSSAFKANMTKQFGGFGKIFTKALWKGTAFTIPKEALASMETYRGSLQKVGRARDLLTVAEQNGTLSAENRTKVEIIELANQERMTKATEEYASVLGITNAQAGTALALENQGIASEAALALAKEEVNEETWEAVSATLAETGAKSYEQVVAALLGKEETKEIGRKLVLNKLRKQGIAGMIASNTIMALETVGKGKGALASLAMAAADKIREKASYSASAAMLVSLGYIGLIIAAVAVLVAGIALLVKAIVDNSPEAKLKKLNAQYEKLGEEISKTKEEVQDLNSKQQELADATDTLRTLTEGTTEWRQALMEINSTVLDLINTYPELMKYVSKGEFGELTISEEGWEEVIQQRLDKEASLQGQQAINRIQAVDEKKDILNNKVRTEAIKIIADGVVETGVGTVVGGRIGGPIGATLAGMAGIGETIYNLVDEDTRFKEKTGFKSEEDLNRFLSKMGEEGITTVGSSKSEFKEIYDELGISGDFEEIYSKIKELGTEFDELAIETEKLNLEQETYRKNLILAATSGIDSVFSKEINYLLENSSKYTNEEIRKIREENFKEAKGMTREERADAYLEMMGSGYTRKGNRVFDSEGNKVKHKDIKQALANEETQKEITKEGERLAEVLEKVGDRFKEDSVELKTFKGILSEAGKDLNSSSLREIANIFGKDISEINANDLVQYLADLGISIQDLGITSDELMENFSKAAEKVTEIYDSLPDSTRDVVKGQINDIISSLKGSYQMGTEQEEQFAKILSDTILRGGDSGQLTNIIKQILSGAKENNQGLIMSELASIDFSDSESIENTLRSMDELSTEIDEGLIACLKEAAKSVKEFNKETVNASIAEKKKAEETIRENQKEGSFVFTEEQKNDILKVMPSAQNDFQQWGEDWVYIGGTLEGLLSAILSDTDFIAKIEGKNGGKTYNDDEVNLVIENSDKFGNYEGTVSKKKNITNTYSGFVSTSSFGYEGYKKTEKAADEKVQELTNQEGVTSARKSRQTMEKDRGGYSYEIIYQQEVAEERSISEIFSEAMEADSYGDMSEELQFWVQEAFKQLGLEFKEGTVKETIQDFLEGYNLYNELKNDQSSYYKYLGAQENGAQKVYGESEFNNVAEKNIALDTMAKEAGITQTAINGLYTGLLKVVKTEDEASLQARYLAADLGQLKKKIDQNAEAVSNLVESLEANGGKGMQGQNDLAALADTFSLIFGGDFDTKFIGEHFADIKGWTEGNEESYNRLTRAIFNYRIAQEEGLAESTTEITSLLNILSGLDLNLYGTVSVDTLSATTDLGKFVNLTIAEMNTLKSIFASTGYQLAFKENEKGGYDLTSATYVGGFSTWTPKDWMGNGDDKGTEEKYKNEYDWLYNLNEAINESLRERENLQTKLNQLLEDENVTSQEITDNINKQMQELKNQQKMYEMMQKSRTAEMQKTMEQNADLQKYATYNFETGQIEIDWTAINAVTDANEGERIDEYISKLEGLQDGIEEVDGSLLDIEDQVKELQDVGKQEYLDLEQGVYDAIVYEREQEIEALEKVNDSINKSNQKLIDNINKSLSKMRQDRENEKTEEEIGDTQSRLLYLSQDTSGMSDLEVMQLQEQLEEQRQSYTDALIDQKISELEEQNAKAEEQRQQQIDILNSQLDHDKETGAIWNRVEGYITNIKDGKIPEGSELDTLLKNAANWTEMSKRQQTDWADDLKKNTAAAMAWYNEGNGLSLDKFDNTNVIDNLKTGIESSFSTLNTAISNLDTGGDVYNYYGDENPGDYETPPDLEIDDDDNGGENKDETPATGETGPLDFDTSKSAWQNNVLLKNNVVGKKLTRSYTAAGYYIENGEAKSFPENFWNQNLFTKEYSIKDAQYVNGLPYVKIGDNDRWFDLIDMKKQGAFNYQFATGGLADFTGPAWLDGTKSRPELVLNARDTQNFIQLKDVLASLIGDGRLDKLSGDSSNGDNYFDIDINVEELKDDYDVEQLANKIKQDIVRDATYRNVNSINFLR